MLELTTGTCIQLFELKGGAKFERGGALTSFFKVWLPYSLVFISGK